MGCVMMERMGVVMNQRGCTFIISLVDPDRSSLHNFGALTMIFIIINYHNSLLIIIDHNNVKIEKLLRMLLM